jgi:hypothetical protein
MTTTNNVTQELPELSRLAFDVNVSNKVIGQYARQGYWIVCCCNEGETDESFLSRAYSAGATHVFSQDADIGIIIEKEEYEMLWVRYL